MDAVAWGRGRWRYLHTSAWWSTISAEVAEMIIVVGVTEFHLFETKRPQGWQGVVASRSKLNFDFTRAPDSYVYHNHRTDEAYLPYRPSRLLCVFVQGNGSFLARPNVPQPCSFVLWSILLKLSSGSFLPIPIPKSWSQFECCCVCLQTAGPQISLLRHGNSTRISLSVYFSPILTFVRCDHNLLFTFNALNFYRY